jgi:integrase
MPRPSKGARLYLSPDTGHWTILDGKVKRRTGTADRREAEAALAAYIRDRGARRGGPAEPDSLTVGEVLEVYLSEHAPTVAAPERLAYAATALLDFWGDLACGTITKATCRRYAAHRGVSDGTVRRELNVLQAALRYCQKDGRLTRAPDVHMPNPPPPRERWLTREEAARLVRAARALPRGRHLAYFILVALYTGTRKEAVLSLRFEPHTAGGWVDLDRGILYRSAQDARQTAKRKTPCRMPSKLVGHLRRLHAAGQRWVVQYQGGRIADVGSAWAAAIEAAGLPGVSPHTLKHTAVTWAMQGGTPLSDAAGFFGTSIETLERDYYHHHPDFQAGAAEAMNRRKG